MHDATPDLLSAPPDVRFTDAEAGGSFPRIIRSSLLRGCNVYHTSSVLSLKVDLGGLAQLRTSDLGPDFPLRFNSYFPVVPPILPPSSSDQGVSSEYRSKLLSPAGVEIGEALLEAIISVEATILRTMFFLDRVQFASVIPGSDDHEVILVWETLDPEMSRSSAEVAVAGFVEISRQNAGHSRSGEYELALLKLTQRAERRRISSSTAVLKRAASRLGIPFEFITRRQLRLGHGVCQQRCLSTMGGSTSYSAVLMSLDKHVSNLQLTQLSLPVPRQFKVANIAEAVAALERIGRPVVVKPVQGNQGRGITIGVKNPQEIDAAFQLAASEEHGVLIEELVLGKDYRLTVVGGKFAAALLCVPPQIRGDGVRTIRQLIDELNAEPDRDKLRFSPITFDDELRDHLDSLGYGLDSIPAPGQLIAVRATGHVSRGGIPIDVTDLVHPDNRKVSEEAARAMGLEIAGVDFVSPDISRSYREIGGRIVEVNSRPGVGMHLWPREGTSRDMGVAILRHMFPDPASACVPFLLVAGDRGRGSVARFVDGMLRAKGLTVGLSLKQGAYINGRSLDVPEDKLQHAPNILLRQPLTQAVAAAVSLRHVAKHGLGLQKCDAVSLVSLDSEKISDEYEKGLAVLLKANRGRFIVSSKNRFARQALSSVDRSRIVLIAADSRDPEVSDHLAIGGAAVVRRWSNDMTGLQFAFVEAGEEVVSTQMPSLSGARQQHIEAAMHAFALTHTTQLS